MKKNDFIPEWVMETIEEARTYFEESFKGKGSRFPGWRSLLKSYTNKYDEILSKNERSFRALQEIHNELCVADALLDINDPHIDMIEYEPRLPNSKKTIDYKCLADSESVYVDVKTIHPATINAWNKFMNIKSRGLIPKNIDFILDPNYLGGEIWHGSFASRDKFLEYAIELEQKISESGLGSEGNLFLLALCGDGINWHLDELEDFVCYYKIGRHRCDDGYSIMESHYIKENKISFTKRIDKFLYFERSAIYIKPEKIVWDVKAKHFG